MKQNHKKPDQDAAQANEAEQNASDPIPNVRPLTQEEIDAFYKRCDASNATEHTADGSRRITLRPSQPTGGWDYLPRMWNKTASHRNAIAKGAMYVGGAAIAVAGAIFVALNYDVNVDVARKSRDN